MMVLKCVLTKQNIVFISQVLPRSIGKEQSRLLTTAYSGIPSDGTLGISEKLPWIPYKSTLILPSGIKDGHRNKRLVEVGPFENEIEWQKGMNLMNIIIQEGRAWPFEDKFTTIESYRGYFLSHTAFVVRALEDGIDSNGHLSDAGDFMGCFYIKPNYPGRCSHICNGGFITEPKFRRQGVAKLMGQVFLQAAKDLGYRSSYFNLVFRSNKASVQLWEGLGFERVAVLEEAARLEGVPGLDTAYGYRYDLTKLPDIYLKNYNNS
jgi:GNAT superfamily N-acetyltransferase